jgi:hypothetical protein
MPRSTVKVSHLSAPAFTSKYSQYLASRDSRIVGAENPNGIPSFSPGLARSDYPGFASQQISTLNGLNHIFAMAGLQPFQG